MRQVSTSLMFSGLRAAVLAALVACYQFQYFPLAEDSVQLWIDQFSARFRPTETFLPPDLTRSLELITPSSLERSCPQAARASAQQT
mmetsp:Transcript_52634/g.122788  ORF Transcript_52634/g.122788 Transcript_52634/m.122788 type:complete len:87 (+) Transcript_52634:1627-1887(+)